MTLFRRILLFVLLFSVCLTVFLSTFGSSASASALTKTLTPAETRTLIGDTIHAKYYNGSQYVDFDFQYSSTWSISSVSSSFSCLPTVGDTVLIYSQSGSISIGGSNSYIQVDLQPEYSFYDTEIIQQYIGVSTWQSVSTATYQSPAWRWFMSTQGDKIFYNDAETVAGSGSQACFYVSFDNTMPFTFVDADYSAQSTFSAYSYRALFYGNTAKSGHVYLAVSCPVVSADSSMASGTGGVTTALTGATGDITVNVDMSQTNGLLGSILDAIEGLISAIAGIFIPDTDFMLQWLDDMHDMLREHFGSFIDAMLIIDSVFDSLHDDVLSGSIDDVTVSSSTIGFARNLSVEVYGVQFSFLASEWQMPLVPQGFSEVVALFKDFLSILFTLMFVNMINNKLHHYLSPQGDS